MKVLRWSVTNVQIRNRLEAVNQNRLVTVCLRAGEKSQNRTCN